MKRYLTGMLFVACAGLCFTQAAFSADPSLPSAPQPIWKPLAEDDLHDPMGAGLSMLQNPGEVLSQLPPDTVGNKVNWTKALRDGLITPRSVIKEESTGKEMKFEMDILLARVNTGDLPRVIFPHKVHTEWMNCKECHDKIFKTKAGTTPITMLAILEGQYCGVCHGGVAFPLTQCMRCHSLPWGMPVPANMITNAVFAPAALSTSKKVEAETPAKTPQKK